MEISLDKSLYGKVKEHSWEAITYIIKYFGFNSTNIIYAHTRHNAEKWAKKIANNLDNEYKIDSEINELAEYLSKDIHPNYSLIRCLKHRVGFHHGCMPEIARNEVEYLFRHDKIKNLVCTPTLLEGVNLPAEKIFIFNPKKNRDDLEDFEFGNLIGRVGRLSYKPYGSVFCIEIEEDSWGENKFESDYLKELEPATVKALVKEKDILFDNLNKKTIEILQNKSIKRAVPYTISLLRHKFLRSEEELRAYLLKNHYTAEEIDSLIYNLSNTMKNISIPKEILQLNPTIDPLLQDELYSSIKKNIDEWIITNMNVQQRIKNEKNLPFNEKDFYGQFEEISLKLNNIFWIEDEINYKVKSRSDRLTIDACIYYAVTWLREHSYKYFVDNELKNANNYRSEDEIDKIIRTVMIRINDGVRFYLVKYFKLWSDILTYIISEENKNEAELLRCLSLPLMLEMGSYKQKTLDLMEEGISRSIAIEISKLISSEYEGSVTEWLQNNSSSLSSLSNLFIRNLKRQHLI